MAIPRFIEPAGNAIPYHQEDPFVSKQFERRLKEEGADSTMPPEVDTAAGARIEVLKD